MGEANGAVWIDEGRRQSAALGSIVRPRDLAGPDEARLLPLVLALLGAQGIAFWALAASGNIPPAVLTLFRALLTF